MSMRSLKQQGTNEPLYLQQNQSLQMLVTGSLNKVSVLPKCVDENEWLASNSNFVNSHQFFNLYRLIVGIYH